MARRVTRSGLFDASWYLAAYPDTPVDWTAALEHWLRIGWAERRDPHPLFDVSWYFGQDADFGEVRQNPVLHYLDRGAAEGRDPHPLFDTSWYASRYPDIAHAGINPLLHYLQQGAAEGRSPHPLFDAPWYLSQYPDVAQAWANPLVHYLQQGVSEGRDPHPLFDTSWYLSRYPDVAQAGINPLVHYLQQGASEGRDPHPLFDTSWYLSQYPDVVPSEINPLAHFVETGAAQGRDPLPLFDTSWYLEQYPEVAKDGANPLVDYVLRGVERKRNPCSRFDSQLYLAVHPGLADGRENPLAHHLETCRRDPTVQLDDYVPANVSALDEDLVASAERAAARICSTRAAEALRLRPLISLVVPVGPDDVAGIEPLVRSVREQTYDNWELHIFPIQSEVGWHEKLFSEISEAEARVEVHCPEQLRDKPSAVNAGLQAVKGTFFALLDGVGSLAETALFELVAALNEDEDLDFVYTDELADEEDGRQAPRPDWSPLLLHGFMYVGELVLLRTDLVRRFGGADPLFGDAYKHELLLRMSGQLRRIGHVRRGVYRSGPAAARPLARCDRSGALVEQLARATTDLLARKGIGWTARPNRCFDGCVEIVPPILGSDLLVGIVVGAQDIDEGREALDSLFETASQSSARLLSLGVIDGNRHGDASAQSFRAGDILKSAVNSGCDFVAFVGRGVRIETPGWVDRLVAFASVEGIALVTGNLLDHDGMIVESGLRVGPDGEIVLAYQGEPQARQCPTEIHCTREVVAVSGAFFVVSTHGLEQLGGMRSQFATMWSAGADLALRFREKRLRNLVCPQILARQTLDACGDIEATWLDNALLQDAWQERLAADEGRAIAISACDGTWTSRTR